jgi:hypothetical protein
MVLVALAASQNHIVAVGLDHNNDDVDGSTVQIDWNNGTCRRRRRRRLHSGGGHGSLLLRMRMLRLWRCIHHNVRSVRSVRSAISGWGFTPNEVE